MLIIIGKKCLTILFFFLNNKLFIGTKSSFENCFYFIPYTFIIVIVKNIITSVQLFINAFPSFFQKRKREK